MFCIPRMGNTQLVVFHIPQQSLAYIVTWLLRKEQLSTERSTGYARLGMGNQAFSNCIIKLLSHCLRFYPTGSVSLHFSAQNVFGQSIVQILDASRHYTLNPPEIRHKSGGLQKSWPMKWTLSPISVLVTWAANIPLQSPKTEAFVGPWISWSVAPLLTIAFAADWCSSKPRRPLDPWKTWAWCTTWMFLLFLLAH